MPLGEVRAQKIKAKKVARSLLRKTGSTNPNEPPADGVGHRALSICCRARQAMGNMMTSISGSDAPQYTEQARCGTVQKNPAAKQEIHSATGKGFVYVTLREEH
jgi:hypothetical protein